ncbi:glutathione S-transferase N-terminal domain-containing protein [Sneathiella sp. CAU 1612]|uniref:Glutathione S-transferase N-terminal domain-containing protein n=1 Tax=Sneathiella sedimenti TaxID=2816034 RepID=A0ABS3F1N2_9PROT|nr:glutathione S-transferase N-terminal domain-containing protein [Sneathiella sedimenti]MBO0332422.1 glutathione S-transferase N-terminal domain-containing protein [Sneathiella sedimenti]
MKLCYSALSPFVRKVRVAAIEHNLMDKIEIVDSDHSDMFKGINPANPLGKVPSLTLENGDVLFDSFVICEYLDSIGSGPSLFPAAGSERWQVLTLHEMANGMTDAAYQRRVDSILPEGEGSPSWSARLKLSMESCLNEMEKQAESYGDKVNIGTIAVGCALGYHDFRFGDEKWRNGRPKLTKWYEGFVARPSMAQTAPA